MRKYIYHSDLGTKYNQLVMNKKPNTDGFYKIRVKFKNSYTY